MSTHYALRITYTVVLVVVLVCVCSPAFAASSPLAGITVVLDPGHGGDDLGMVGGGLYEKVLVLDIAERIERQLVEQGAQVYVTRQQDQFVSLAARVRFTNILLFRPDNAGDHGRSISLHLNSNPNINVTRVEVQVDPMAPANPFATILAEELAEATGGGFGYRDAGYPPGVHPADVAPVRWTYPRSDNVLSESAFLSNAGQAEQLHDPALRQRIADAHVRALRRALER